MVAKRESWGGDELGIWNQHILITVYKIDNQQGPESLCGIPETNTTL